MKDFVFKNIAVIDVDDWEERVLNETEETWNKYTFRQERYGVHRHTTTIPLYWSEDFSTEPFCFHEFNHYFPLVEKVKSYFPGKRIVKAMLARMKPGTFISPHIDHGPIFELSHRVHLPLKTNENVKFIMEETNYTFEKGHLIEINNQMEHSVENRGDEDRIHFIVDLI